MSRSLTFITPVRFLCPAREHIQSSGGDGATTWAWGVFCWPPLTLFLLGQFRRNTVDQFAMKFQILDFVVKHFLNYRLLFSSAAFLSFPWGFYSICCNFFTASHLSASLESFFFSFFISFSSYHFFLLLSIALKCCVYLLLCFFWLFFISKCLFFFYF